MFLTVVWQGKPISVAVIQAYEVTDWIAGIVNPPQQLGAPDGRLLQVVTLEALDAVAGRVVLIRNGVRKTVIFETSGGILKGIADDDEE
jgi:hypothetical protein